MGHPLVWEEAPPFPVALRKERNIKYHKSRFLEKEFDRVGPERMGSGVGRLQGGLTRNRVERERGMDPKAVFLRNVSASERGDETLLKNHLRGYAAYFQGKKDVVDLGCGSGVFLELLKEVGIPAYGVEDNPAWVSEGKARGLRIVHKKIQSFLKNGRAASVDGFFLSHVLEHLPASEAMEVLAQIHRMLKPGGVLVMVTPNPLSLGVMTHSFWRDPTHVRPYPSDFLAQFLESLGFRVLEKGETCLGPRRSIFSWVVRKARTLLVGDYFRDPDVYLAAQK